MWDVNNLNASALAKSRAIGYSLTMWDVNLKNAFLKISAPVVIL